MAKTGKPVREIRLEYSYDRLSAAKMGQVYGLLVPDKAWAVGVKQGKDQNESGSHLRPSLLGKAKGRADDSQPDGSSNQVRTG